jgi:group I intron endonuclease
MTSLCYVGRAKCVRRRWNEHVCELRKGEHRNDYMRKAWAKYGERAFSIEILEECSLVAQGSAEQAWLDAFHGSPEVMNIAANSTAPTLGRTFSLEVRERVSASLRGKSRHTGARPPMPPHVRAILTAARAEKPATEKQRAALTRLGTRHSSETRLKMSATHMASHHRAIPLVSVNTETGETVTHRSIRQASAGIRGREEAIALAIRSDAIVDGCRWRRQG